MIKYVFFDVAGTLLGKPLLYTKIQETLSDFGYAVTLEELKKKHKLLSEVIHFPDRTDAAFYQKFNADLLYLLGIVPHQKLLDALFKACTYLPWEAYEDTKVLQEIKVPIGVLSNFNSTLREKLESFFGPIFSAVFVSEELGVAKPSSEFYQKAFSQLECQPNEILYIGDSIKLDLAPAEALGCKVLIIDRDDFYPALNNKISNLATLTKFL